MNKSFSIWGKRVLYKLALIVFVYKPGQMEPSSVLPQSFFISLQIFYYFFQSYLVPIRHQQQYLDPVVIGYPL